VPSHPFRGSRVVLATMGRPASFGAGAVLLRQGEHGHHVLALLDGWAKVCAVSSTGEQVVLALRGPGDVLGEMAVFDGQPRSAAVTALTDVTVRIISAEQFVSVVLASADLSLTLLQQLAYHLRESDRKRLEYSSTGTFQRLAILLVDLADRLGSHGSDGTVSIELPLTQRELADAAAMSREALAQGLRRLRERDLVRTQRRRITVVRMEELRGIATGDGR
jgi:CRP/FNR family transcriptional regulator, cyclic AMP receptor protein